MQLNIDIHGELIIDNFAGGGGASTGIELALGRRVDIAINHDPEAVAMHTANHPETKHYCESVWEIDPREVTQGRPVGLVWHYGSDQDPRLDDPLHTVTTKDRYGLVTVAGEEYAIADIGLRMLAPRELFKAQGFPDSYITEWGIDPKGQRISLTKSAQVRMCGNSVCPPVAAALVRANLPELAIARRSA